MTDINDVYRQRNNLAIAFCKAALAAGWPAGRGVDDTKEPDDEWRHVVYVDLPSGDQVSWHMAPCAVHLLEGLPEYKGKWEGTFTARHKNWPSLLKAEETNRVPIQAVAVTREDGEGQLYLEWLLEGGICELELPGQYLLVAPEHPSLCEEDGSAELFISGGDER